MSIYLVVEAAWAASILNSLIVLYLYQLKVEKMLGRSVERFATMTDYLWGMFSLTVFAPVYSLMLCTERGSRRLKQLIARVVSARPENNVTSKEETMLLRWADE